MVQAILREDRPYQLRGYPFPSDMALPTYQDCMLPALRLIAQGVVKRGDVVQRVADLLGVTEEDRQRLLPSGKGPVILSRVAWAIAYMKQAGLVEAPRRGVYRITDRGEELLRSAPQKIDIPLLERYPEFIEFQNRSRPSTDRSTPSSSDGPDQPSESTPEEALELAHGQLRQSLEADLLDQVRAASPAFFEQLVVDLLLRIGYGGSREEAGRVIGGSGDGGVDGIISEDRLGLDVIYIQAKRWADNVGRPEVEKFAGALQGHRAKKGVFLTTAGFTKGAEEYVRRIDARIVLIDGVKLASLMYEHNVGVAVRAQYEVKQIDSDYFGEE